MTESPSFPRHVRVRSEVDVLALVSVTLGFHPRESLVLVTLDRSGGCFQARVDLPVHPMHLDDAVSVVLEPALRAGARQALLVAYSDDASLAGQALKRLSARLERAGVVTVCSLRADGDRWWPGHDRRSSGSPYDLATHPLLADSILRGQVTYPDREALAASLESRDRSREAEVALHVAALTRAEQPETPRPEWLKARMAELYESAGSPPTAETHARLALALQRDDLRDLVWGDITRGNADTHVQVWRALLPGTPEELRGPVGGLLAFAAWLAGDGALARCAVERTLRADPGNRMAILVAQALDRAVPPSVWEPPDRRLHALPGLGGGQQG